jgi:hypothetical protein
MDEGAVGFLVLTSISVLVAVAGHAFSARFALTTLLSGLLSIAVFLGLVIARGDRDPFIAIAAVVGAVYSLFIAGLVGLAFAQIRSWRLVRRRQTSA